MAGWADGVLRERHSCRKQGALLAQQLMHLYMCCVESSVLGKCTLLGRFCVAVSDMRGGFVLT